jgi:hypothetical protein
MNNEPVAWMQVHYKDGTPTKFSKVKTWEDDVPLYTHQYERPHNTVLVPCDKLAEMQAQIETMKNPIMQTISQAFDPAKTLTDEDLFKVYADLQENYTGNNFPVDLGRAILRKAQEK